MGKLRRILGFLSFLAIIFFGTNSFADNTEPCLSGLYFDASVSGTKTCPGNGYYCPGFGDYDVDGTTNACLEKCSSDLGGAFFNKSSVGASNSNTDCWGVVYLNKNGGRGTIYNEDTTDDAIATCFSDDMTGAGCILGTNITRSGYKFNGWGTSEDCTSGITVYTDTSKASPTLYACWVPVRSVSLYNSGGTSTYGSDYIYAIQNTGWYSDASGTQKLSEIPIPTKENCTFNGYFFEDMEMVTSAGKLNLGSTSVINQNIEIVAEWTCKITCNAGTYYDASTQSCATCPAGYYCTGGPFDKTNVDQGITECPGDFTDGGSGLSSEDQCKFTLKSGTVIDSCDNFTVSVYETCDTKNNYFCPGYSVTVGDVDPANNMTWCSDYGRYKCPENSTTNFSYCTCNTGYFGWSGGAGGNKIDRLTSPTHTCMRASYYCEQGTYLPAGQTTCATCPAGSYCIGDTYGYDASNDSGIEACPEGYTSSGGAGSEDECYKKTYNVQFYCEEEKETIIATQHVVFMDNIQGPSADVANAACKKPGYHVINYFCNNFEVMPGSTATYVSPFQEECVAEWGKNNYFITIDYNTPVLCTDAELCGTFVGKEAPALTAGDAQYKATKDIAVQYNGTLAAVPIEYQQRKGYELVYYVPYPEDVTIFLDPNNESDATSMLWMVKDGDTGERFLTTKWTYDGGNNTSIRYYPMWRAKTIKCDNGGYLPAGSEECAICPAGSYCEGGPFEYSDTIDQGIDTCPANSISSSDRTYCVCSDGYTVDGLAGGGKNVTSVENGTCQVVQCTAGNYYVPSENVKYPCSEGYYCDGTGDAMSRYDSDAEISCDAKCPTEFPESAEGANSQGDCYKTCPEGSMSNIATPDNPNACEEQKIYYMYFYCSEEDKNNRINHVTYYDVRFGAGTGMLPTSDRCTKTGHSFTKWSCESFGTHAAGEIPSDVYNVAASDHCAAVWEPYTLTINYEVGNGVLSDDAITTCKYGDAACVAPTATAPDGDVFNGWTVQTTDGTKYFNAGDNLAELAANGDTTVTLTAKYDKKVYFVSFYCDDAKTKIITTADVTLGEQLEGLPSVVAEEACGITDKQVVKYVCGNHEVSPGETVMYSSTITEECVALWEAKPATTVTCDPGTFLPANSDSVDDCELCRNSGYCVGGEYELNSTEDQGIEACPVDYGVSEAGAENIGKCYNSQTEACTDPCGGERYCKNCPNDSFLSCAYDTTAKVDVKYFYSGETEVDGDETCPVLYNTYTKCSSGMYLTNSAKDCSAKCSALTGSCKNATGGTETCWSSSINANMSAGANACYGAGCTPTCNLFNDYVLGNDGKLTGEYVNHCPEHATCIEATLPSNGYRWYPNTICTPTTFCSFTYTCDAGYVASTTGNIEYGYSRALRDNPMTAITIASCDPGVFKVTLDANGGTGGTTTMYQKYTVGWYSDESASNALGTITIPTKDRYTFTGYYINDVEVVDKNGNIKSGVNNLFTSDGVITAQWAAKPITCDAGYYYDYANMACAECQSPYYCPGGTFDMTVDGDNSVIGKKDCKIDAFPYYAIANADKVFSDAKADDITDCYITIPAGKQINENWGLEDLQSGWANNGTADYYYTGSIPGIRDYATKCSEDRYPFINESPVGATNTYQCYGTIMLDKNEGTGSLNGEDANSRTATVTCSFETLDVYGKCELPMTGITKKGAKLAGWSVNDKCMDNVSLEYLTDLTENQLPLLLSACWESKQITCDPGYYFDYDNQKCAECMSPYYCPGGTFDMDDVNADGRADCRIDAFSYYAKNIDASAIGAYRGAKVKTDCYVMLPAGKEIVSVDGQIADLRSGYYFGGGQVQYTGDIPDFTEYATKCSDDLGMSFYEHSNVGAESYTECYGTITLNKSGATGLLYDQSNNVINGDSETAQSVEYKCYATGDDANFCSLPKTTGLSREGWSIGGWDTMYGCTGTAQTQINLNNMTSGTDMYVCMSRRRITCDAGMYLPMGATTCRECEMGKYCPGGTFTYSESADNGLNQCPSIFTYGDTGTKSESECRTMANKAQYIKYANGVFQIAQDDSDNEYCTGGTLTYGQAMTDVAKGEDTWFKYQCPSNSSNTDGAPYCLCNENYTTSSDDATLIALNAAISGDMCLRNTCEAGTYMKNNECVVCPAGNVCSTDVPGNAPKTCSELTGGLYTLSAPGSSSIDACYTECEEYAITNGTAVPVEDTAFYPFECEFTGRSQTGNPCDIVNGTCIETSCNHNFELINGICTPCARENAISYKQGGNCVIESCVSGFHPNGQVCEANVIECSAPNAIASTQKWDSNKNAFGECIITECADGYHLGSNACQANEQVCELEHGIGVREWNHNTNKWGECVATECDPGYTNDSSLTNEGWKQCGRCNNMYSANGELAVSSYVKGCEIASCMYQGELYNLENNECRLICDTYSDETGSRKWNASRKKCEHTCAPGYVTW